MWEREKSRRWVSGLVLLVLIVSVVVRSRGRERRQPVKRRLATIEVDGEKSEITTTMPGVTAVPPTERHEIAGRPEGAEAVAEAEELLVEVVTADGTPAAGARVAMLDTLREFQSSYRIVLEPGDPDDDFDLAEFETADEQGRTWLPRPRGNARLAAWHAGDYGELALYPSEPGPVRLVLSEDPPVEVRVVRSDGSPLADVPVVLRTPKGVVATRSTREDGSVLLFARGRRAELVRSGAFVQLGIPLREAVFVPVDPERDGPIELVAPALGAVEVRLVEGREDWGGNGRVRLGLSERLQDELAPEALLTGYFDTLAHGGRARFAHVGLGLELFVVASTEWHGEAGREIAGPMQVGEVVELELPLGAEGVRLMGRLLGADAAALGEVRSEFVAEGPDGSWTGRQVLTDREGGFRVLLPASPAVLTFEALAVAVVAPRGSEHAATFPVRFVPGLNELGDLHLARAPLLVAGRVRDEGGAPMKGRALEALAGFDPSNPVSGEPFAKLVSDAFGCFALHGTLPEEGDFALRVWHAGFRWGPEAVTPGTSDLEIVVRATGSLALEVLHSGGWMPNVQLFQGGVRVGSQSLRYEGNSQHLTIESLFPGEYDLEWSHPWAPERGFVRGLLVVAGEKAVDPRLAPLDLREAWPRVRLSIVDEADGPVTGARLELWRDGNHAAYTQESAGSELDVVAGPLPLRARLSATGFRTRELELDADATVVLTRGPRLCLRAPTLPELPRDWEWAVWIRPTSSRERWPTPITLQSGANELSLEAAGPHELWVGAVRRHGNWNDEAGGGLGLELEIEEDVTSATLPPFEPAQFEGVLAEIAESDPFAPR